MAPGDMFFIEHLNELRIRFFRIVVFSIAIVIFTSVFGIQLITINKFSFYFIYHSIYNNNYILPITILFSAGILFSFYMAIPIILTFLYQYGQSLGILSFLTINEFINFVLQFFIAFGISFQLPLIMYILSLTGLIDNKFWIKNFKYAVILIVLFGAFITPDGSGVTMWFISIPMLLLYTIGILSIKVRFRKDDKNKLVNI